MGIKYDLNASHAARGMALLMLLWHHLFFMMCSVYSLPVCISSNYAKVCVAIFILLSGYSLASTVKDKPIGLMAFYKRRLSRLYMNYWLIAIIFISIGILFGYRPLESVFPTAPYLKLFLQMTGFHMFIDDVGLGFNPTWWFMSTILALYVLFPLIYYMVKKFGLWFLFACFFLNFPPNEAGKWFMLLIVWLFTFSLGIYLARTNGLVKISMMLKRIGFFRFIILGASILITVYIRQYVAWLYQIDFNTILGFDWISGTIIILLIFEITQAWSNGQIVLAFLGRHLFNIFLFHMFILMYWPYFIYGFDYPALIFFVLLAISIIVSMAIELIKKPLQFKAILSKIDGIQVKDYFFIKSE
jgi:Acyltransferase family